MADSDREMAPRRPNRSPAAVDVYAFRRNSAQRRYQAWFERNNWGNTAMTKKSMKYWALALSSGAFLLQAASCVPAAAVVTSVSSLATAGGVFYLIFRIVDN